MKIEKKLLKKHLYKKEIKIFYFFIIIMVLLSFFCLASSPLNSTGFHTRDSAVFQVMGRGILCEKVPYRDFFDHKGPLMYFIDAFAYVIHNKYGLFIVENIFNIIGLYFLYKIMEKLCDNKILNGILLFIYIFSFYGFNYYGNLTESYYINITYVAMYYIVKILIQESIKNRYYIYIGICIMLNFLLKATYVSVVIPFYIISSIQYLKKHDYKGLLKCISYSLLGVIIAFLPTFIYLIITGSFFDFINDGILFNFKYITSSFSSKIYNIVFSLKLICKIFTFSLLSIILLLLKNDVNKNLKIYAISFFIIQFILTCISNTVYYHYFIMIIPSIILIALIVGIPERMKLFYSAMYILNITILIIFMSSVDAFGIEYPYEEEIGIIESYNIDDLLVLGNESNLYLALIRCQIQNTFFNHRYINMMKVLFTIQVSI